METPMARTDQWKVADPGLNGDRLSSLPDEILSRILSFLQTKHAFCTTILSRRWKNLWTRVSNLDLDNYRPSNSYLDFLRFVDRVMGEHRDLNSLKRFRLHFSSGCDRNVGPTLWSKMELESASELEEIDVRLQFYTDRVPESFYTLQNLRVLKLGGVMMMMATHGSVFLPSLKVLQLSQVKTVDGKSLSRFISGCPVLETAHLEECYCSSNMNEEHKVTASLPCLKSLTVIGKRDLDAMVHPIVVEAPSVEHLELQDFWELEIVGSGCPLSCLESVTVDIRGRGISSDHSFIGLLTPISNAKQMRFSWQTLNLLSEVSQDDQLPAFPQLIHLTIDACDSSQALHSLLNSASKLQTLVIHSAPGSRRRMVWADSEPACAPECLSSSLQEIEIHNLLTVGDTKMVAYFLNAGAVLKKVHMHLYPAHFSTEKRRALASLLKLPRRSSTCEARLFYSNCSEFCVDDD